MTKDKLPRLLKYQELVKSKLSDPVPEKHKDRPDAYKALLTRELQLVTLKINALKL